MKTTSWPLNYPKSDSWPPQPKFETAASWEQYPNISSWALMMITGGNYTKEVEILGRFPLPIEVLEIARSAISREIMKMGGKPVYRNGFITDNGNQIIDVHNFPIEVPFELEEKLNNIPGVVENGIFSNRKADVIINAKEQGIDILDL